MSKSAKVLAVLLSLVALLAVVSVCYAVNSRPIYLMAEYSIASPDFPEWMYRQALLMKKAKIMRSRQVGDVVRGVTSAVDGLGATARTDAPRDVRIDRANALLGRFDDAVRDARIGDRDITSFAILAGSTWLLDYLIRNRMQACVAGSGLEDIHKEAHEKLRSACASGKPSSYKAD